MNIPTDAIPGGPPSTAGGQDEEAAKRAAEQEMRKDVIARILEPAARERLSRISLVSQQRAQQIEAVLIRMAQGGQLRSKVTETQLIDLLDQFEEVQDSGKTNKSKIIYQRRKDLDDDFDI
ncbi:hypothetical protein CC1G_05078 [Coprinopsis cinerea okayama7|uniref:Programmed cell death protein 5 n=1 Tax=Coprinopsis cinerea (strain Okayama-7 / 130 / ATCC MYA-4618 / FGSC 9003) TaxID=240176 RepID=A8NG90_COPC7|nr:hypothetical protein CC1G_05078 [Coprinopsis cinerea okayama7\|eukprot:XP_001833378.2 hypothetical protein CC1G_05078 [Coprinopsis cinerea okayama7\